MLEEQYPMFFSADNLSSIAAAKISWVHDFLFTCTFYTWSFCFCFRRNIVAFCEQKVKEI